MKTLLHKRSFDEIWQHPEALGEELWLRGNNGQAGAFPSVFVATDPFYHADMLDNAGSHSNREQAVWFDTHHSHKEWFRKTRCGTE